MKQATSALNTITENSIQEALMTLGHNRTVLVIAHRLSTIKHAHQIVVMDGGRVLEVGSHEQLLSDPNSRYSEMWAMQSSSIGSRSPLGQRSSESTPSQGNSHTPSPTPPEDSESSAMINPLVEKSHNK